MTGNGTDKVELRVVGYSPRPQGMGVLRVQIGAFSDPQNAKAMFQRARSEFAGGRIVSVDLSGERFYRVQIGQFVQEVEAQAASARLDRRFDIQSFVVRDDG